MSDNETPAPAWRTTVCEVHSVVFAESRGKARQAVYRAAKEAGYRVTFTDVRCVRAPDLDGRNVGRHVLRQNACFSVLTVLDNTVERARAER